MFTDAVESESIEIPIVHPLEASKESLDTFKALLVDWKVVMIRKEKCVAPFFSCNLPFKGFLLILEPAAIFVK